MYKKNCKLDEKVENLFFIIKQINESFEDFARAHERKYDELQYQYQKTLKENKELR